MRMLRRALFVALLSLSAAEAGAQVTVGAAIGQSRQSEGKSDSPYLGPGFGGTNLAGIGMIDVAVGSRVSVGGEISLAGDISGTQSERVPGGSNTVVSDHHDTIWSGVVKVGTPSTARVRGAAVIGGAIVQRHTERNGTFHPFSMIALPSPVHETLSDNVVALTAGIDVAVSLGDHLALLGLGRIYQLKDDDRTGSGVVHRGVSSTILRYGGGLQLRF